MDENVKVETPKIEMPKVINVGTSFELLNFGHMAWRNFSFKFFTVIRVSNYKPQHYSLLAFGVNTITKYNKYAFSFLFCMFIFGEKDRLIHIPFVINKKTVYQ